MAQYFFSITKEERENILDKHKLVYDGYATKNSVNNEQPLYVQDFANDKNGITINNKGDVTEYKNVGINEQHISLGKYSDEEKERREKFEKLPDLGASFDKFKKSIFDDEEEDTEDDNFKSDQDEQYSKVNYLGTDIDEGILDFFKKGNKSKKIPYTAEAVEKIIKMIKDAKTEEHLKSLMQMVDNLVMTNDDVNDAYKERIHNAYRRKSDELGNYLTKKDISTILKDVESDVEFNEDYDKIKESIVDSLSWMKKINKY